MDPSGEGAIMSGDKSTVTLDGEWLLARIQEIEYILDRIRAEAADGAFAKGPRQDRDKPRARTRDGTPVFPSPRAGTINTSGIEWKLKGSEPADFNAPWAWVFAYDKDGYVLPETEAIVNELMHTEKVQVGDYEITLSGRDKNLLSRKKITAKRGPKR